MPSVSKVIISDTNPYYTVSDDMLYTKDMKTLIGCPPTLDRKELHIAEQTETIGDYAFFACMSLEKIVLLHKWLRDVPDTHLANWKASDLTKDGKINIFDFIRLKYLLLETN